MSTVLHLIEQLSDFGGTPRMLLSLAAHHDHAPGGLVFATYRPSPLKSEFERHGAEVVDLDSLSVVRLAWRVAALARARDARVIATHHTRPLVVGWLAARLTGLPLVHHEHSSARYRAGIGHHLARWTMPSAQAVVCVSRHVATSVSRAYDIAPERLHVLYNPVEAPCAGETREAVRARLGVGRDGLLIGHVGGMIPARDQATLVRAFGELRATFPDSRMVLIGDGPLRDDLEREARRAGLGEAVVFTGYTTRVGDYLRALDIYVNPTLDEGFGIAVAEAMLAGVPVIAADAGAHPELIRHGETGLLYRGGDAGALARALAELAMRPGAAAMLARAARSTAEARFAPGRHARDHAELLAAARREQPQRVRAWK